VTDLAKLFRALADESRLRILSLLISSGELCVCDIQRVLDATQTKVSRHLKYLKRAGLVADRRKGLWILYSIAEPLSNEQRLILSCVSKAAGSHPACQGDIQKLREDIRSGCCATFLTVRPAAIPSHLKQRQQRREIHV